MAFLRAVLKMQAALRAGASWSGRERNFCYLNTRDSRFANISDISGLGFIDDARSLAVCDWDGDGALDFWLCNRTGPRIRFMKNAFAQSNHFLALQLVGTNCNRDAIGARIEVRVADSSEPPLIKSLRAGEGLLAQSSKVVHVGLGKKDFVESLTVRWPDGNIEEFHDVQANKLYRIVQGSGAIELLRQPRGDVMLAASTLPITAGTGEARVVLPTGPRMSNVPLRTMSGENTKLRKLVPDGPTLVNLWQHSCVPCLKELQEFAHEAETIRDRGLNIVAIHLSTPGTDSESETAAAHKALASFDFPFLATMATDDGIARLQKLQKRVLQKHRGVVFPTSFLLDAEQRIVVIYKGSTTVDELLQDMALLKMSDEELLTASLPFSGKWIDSPLEERPEE